MKKRILYALLILIAGIVVYRLVMFSLSKLSPTKKQERMEKIPVKAVAARRMDMVKTVKLTGDIVGTEAVKVFSQVPGKVHSILIKEGQRVTKGSTVFKINRDIVGMEYMLAIVESPISGFVGEIMVDRGMTIAPTTPLAQVVNMNTVEAVVRIMEEKINLIQIGMMATINVEAFPGKQFIGRVYKKSAVLNQLSHTQEVRIVIRNSDLSLKHGMFADVNIIIDRKENTIAVPVDSLISEQTGKHHVYKIVESKAVKQDVTVGITVEDFTEIQSGLAPGDLVITLGHENVVSGDELIVYREDVVTSKDEIPSQDSKEKQE
jgi:multidrug efflux pump subunit AcrA (membrane-fusion protein)